MITKKNMSFEEPVLPIRILSELLDVEKSSIIYSELRLSQNMKNEKLIEQPIIILSSLTYDYYPLNFIALLVIIPY